MTRALRLIRPAPKAARVVYERWPIWACGMAIDRRADWQAKRDTAQAERNREAAQAQSRAIGASEGEG